MYARRLQVQERLTQQIADFLMARLNPKGVGVRDQGDPPLCDDARRPGKPGHAHDDERRARYLPIERQDPRRVLLRTCRDRRPGHREAGGRRSHRLGHPAKPNPERGADSVPASHRPRRPILGRATPARGTTPASCPTPAHRCGTHRRGTHRLPRRGSRRRQRSPCRGRRRSRVHAHQARRGTVRSEPHSRMRSCGSRLGCFDPSRRQRPVVAKPRHRLAASRFSGSVWCPASAGHRRPQPGALRVRDAERPVAARGAGCRHLPSARRPGAVNVLLATRFTSDAGAELDSYAQFPGGVDLWVANDGGYLVRHGRTTRLCGSSTCVTSTRTGNCTCTTIRGRAVEPLGATASPTRRGRCARRSTQ